VSQLDVGRTLNRAERLLPGIGAGNASLFLMRNACPAAALVLATTFFGGCVTASRGTGTPWGAAAGSWSGTPSPNGDPIWGLTEAFLMEIDRQTQPKQRGPLCDPPDPSPPATCPPSTDEKPR